MKKKYNELTQEEEVEFVNELSRMFIFGSAALQAASKNSGEESRGWPHISVGVDIVVSMCEALDLLRKSSRNAVIRDLTSRPLGFLALASPKDVEDLSIHEAMHDAFCLGMAAVVLFEMDFAGIEELIAEFNRDQHE